VVSVSLRKSYRDLQEQTLLGVFIRSDADGREKEEFRRGGSSVDRLRSRNFISPPPPKQVQAERNGFGGGGRKRENIVEKRTETVVR